MTEPGVEEGAAPPEEPRHSLGRSELRRRALSGAAVVGARGVAINALAFLGNVVLARLLVPSEFGLVALGLAVLTLATLLTDGGLGAGLVRRPEPPTRDDLRTLMAIQVYSTVAIALLSVGPAIAFGGAAELAAIMLAGLPISALRGPGMVTLERDLDFRPIAAVDVSESLAYYAWGIGAVAAGLGVWGLASASVVKALVGTLVLLRRSPVKLVAPRTTRARTRELLGFGVKFQGVQVVSAVRDQGISFGIAAVAGAATLGLWTVAWRLLQVPFLLFQALWQVSFPAMAQLVAGGDDPRPVIERVARLAAVATGIILTAIAGSAPALIPALFGADYSEAREAVPWVCVALQISGPVSVAVAGYLFASGRTGVVLRAAVVQVFIWFAVGLGLLTPLGVSAVGIGFCAAALTETAIFGRAVHAATGVRLAHVLLAPFAAAVAASAVGWLLADALGPTLPSAIAGAAVAVGAFVLLLLAIRRPLVLDVVAVARSGIGSAARA